MVILLAQVCGPKWEGCHKERLWGLQTLFGPRSPAFSPSVPGLYRSSLEAPEAFQAEYEASSNRVLSILQSLLARAEPDWKVLERKEWIALQP